MKKILLVEDDESLRSALADTLVSEGYAVTETTDGAAAKGIMSIKEFDLVVVDMKMPHVTGGELFEWAHDKFPTPFIIISGYVELQDKNKADLLGIRHFIPKPFKSEQLLSAIKKVFSEPRPAFNSNDEFDLKKKSKILKLSVDDVLVEI